MNLEYTPINILDLNNLDQWDTQAGDGIDADPWKLVAAIPLHPDYPFNTEGKGDSAQLWVCEHNHRLDVELHVVIDGQSYIIDHDNLNTTPAHVAMSVLNITREDLPREIREKNWDGVVFPYIDQSNQHADNALDYLLAAERASVLLPEKEAAKHLSNLEKPEVVFLEGQTWSVAHFKQNAQGKWDIAPDLNEDGLSPDWLNVGLIDALAAYRDVWAGKNGYLPYESPERCVMHEYTPGQHPQVGKDVDRLKSVAQTLPRPNAEAISQSAHTPDAPTHSPKPQQARHNPRTR